MVNAIDAVLAACSWSDARSLGSRLAIQIPLPAERIWSDHSSAENTQGRRRSRYTNRVGTSSRARPIDARGERPAIPGDDPPCLPLSIPHGLPQKGSSEITPARNCAEGHSLERPDLGDELHTVKESGHLPFLEVVCQYPVPSQEG